MIDRPTAINFMLHLPHENGKDEPCSDVNPYLWLIWCEAQERDPNAYSTIWTEYNVVESCVLAIRRYLNELL